MTQRQIHLEAVRRRWRSCQTFYDYSPFIKNNPYQIKFQTVDMASHCWACGKSWREAFEQALNMERYFRQHPLSY